ncbi:MAG: hypothetical protein H8E91_07610 [Planctomycetes bacterium]|nr:hypothetical protein [Planctomycetota bacterium]
MAIFFCASCNDAQKSGGPSLVNAWAYVPQSVDVHPLSRFGSEDIVIHVAFEDGDGFECRAVGTLKVTLSGSTIESTSKSVDLSNSLMNRERFDRLTRTYLFRFSEVPSDLAKVKVSVTFIPQQGTNLHANGTVEK